MRSFSRPAVFRNASQIQAKIDEFVAALGRVGCGERGRPLVVNLSLGFRCLTADVITDYCFGTDFGGLKTRAFRNSTVMAARVLFVSIVWGLYFPKLIDAIDALVEYLPEKVLQLVFPSSVLGIRDIFEVSSRFTHSGQSSTKQPSLTCRNPPSKSDFSEAGNHNIPPTNIRRSMTLSSPLVPKILNLAPKPLSETTFSEQKRC